MTTESGHAAEAPADGRIAEEVQVAKIDHDVPTRRSDR
jgi:hypothetical protein